MSYFTNNFFSKELYEISEQDVIDFFKNNQFETTYLELKSGEVSLEKIYKEVVALHNSEGGLIVIGAPKPRKDKDGNEFFDGELTRSVHKNKDWLYQKICHNISPMPVGLKIHDVCFSDNKIIQIIDIPKSINPPHQSLSDGIYYLRFETQSRFAPHSFVEALFNKRKSPVILFEDPEMGIYKPDNSFYTKLTVNNLSDIPIIGFEIMVEYYNINELIKIDGDISIGKKYDNYLNLPVVKLEDNSIGKTTLVKGISISFDSKIKHLDEAFFVNIYAWGENLNLQRKVFIICPVNYGYRGIELVDEVFESIQENIKDILDKNPKSIREPYEKLLKKINDLFN